MDAAQEHQQHSSERTLVRRPAIAASAAAVAPPTPLAHALLLRHEGSAPRRIPLDPVGAALHIGRGQQNHLVLPSPDVSRQHCTVAIQRDAAVVTDLGSTNGVHVDGARIREAAVLGPGSRLVVGPYTLRYQRGTTEELAQAEAREHEQARAVAYIQALLPQPLQDGPVRAEWRLVPSALLGGDAFGYRWLDDDHSRFALFLLDVSGHGVGSALLAASAANLLRAQGSLGGVDPADPAKVLSSLNAVFPSDEQDGLFFSFWYGVYEPAGRTLRFASAGHHPAYLTGEASALQPLATRAPAIGMSPAARFRVDQAVVPPGGRLYLFSDGAFELTMPDGRAGGISDLLALLAAPSIPGTSEPDRVFEALRELNGRRPFEDDVSLLSFDFP